MADQQLLGRRAETARLDEMIAAVRAGESRVLVIRGTPGVGKSALLAHAGESATDMRELAFAALQQLCGPLLDRLDSVPGPGGRRPPLPESAHGRAAPAEGLHQS